MLFTIRKKQNNRKKPLAYALCPIAPIKMTTVPPCFSNEGLYSGTGALQLPLVSLEEEFKVGKLVPT